jgi:hypothetical protein
VNGEMLTGFEDNAYARGGLGLIASNVDATKPHIHYDNVRVYSTEGEAAESQSASLPTSGSPAEFTPLLIVGAALLLLGAGMRARQLSPRSKRR